MSSGTGGIEGTGDIGSAASPIGAPSGAGFLPKRPGSMGGFDSHDDGELNPDPIPNRIAARPVPRPGRIVAAVVLILLAGALLWSVANNQTFRWDLVWLYLRDVVVIRGVAWTLVLTFGSMLLGAVMAVALAVMRRGDNPVARVVASAFIFVFRGTPVYVQLVFWGLLSVLYPTIGLRIPFGP